MMRVGRIVVIGDVPRLKFDPTSGFPSAISLNAANAPMPGGPLLARLRAHPDLARFWSYVDRSAGADGCWPWAAGHTRDPAGYGRLYLGNCTVRWTRPQDYYEQAPWRGT